MKNNISHFYDLIPSWEEAEKPLFVDDLIKNNPDQKELIIVAAKVAVNEMYFRRMFFCEVCGKQLTKVERFRIQRDVHVFNYVCTEHYQFRSAFNLYAVRKNLGIEYNKYDFLNYQPTPHPAEPGNENI